MKEPTKNIITRDDIANKISERIKDEMSELPLIFALVLAPCFLFGIIFICGDLSILETLLYLSPIFLPLLLIPITALIFNLRTRKKILCDKFEITVGQLRRKREIRTKHTERFLYFEGFWRKMVDYSQFEHAVIGEKYYIVHCTKSRYIQLVYPTKAYELK